VSTERTLIFILVVISFIAVCLNIFLIYLYLSQKGQILLRIQEAKIQWRERELETLRIEQRETAHKEALEQLQMWREKELELARRQQLEFARSEALTQLEQWKTTYTQEIRQEAIQKSQAVTVGKITEHFVPYLPEFEYNPKDARFLGSPIDFVVFDGLDKGEVSSIVFAEVKTGSSMLNTRERQIRDAVQAGKVKWVEIRPRLGMNSETLDKSEEKCVSEVVPPIESETNSQSSDKKTSTDRLRLIMK
jgi:predicted Holliday junction resolvase-like endonuclease